MVNSWKYLALVLCLFLVDVHADEQDEIFRIHPGDSFPVELASSVQYFEDETGLIELKEARSYPYKPLPDNQIAFGYTRSKFWLRFGFSNDERVDRELVLRTFVRFMRPLEIYQRTNNGDFEKMLYNDQDSIFGQRPEGIRHLAHQFTIPANSTVDFYIRFGAGGTASLPLVITDGKQIREEQYQATIKIVLFLAIIGTLVLSNLFYFVAIRAWA